MASRSKRASRARAEPLASRTDPPRGGRTATPGDGFPAPPSFAAADGLSLALVLAATVITFSSVTGHPFLNWDDPDALVRNQALGAPDVVRWALTTTHMSHYQPLSWLMWAALRSIFGEGALVHHVASLALHVLSTALVFLLARRLSWPAGDPATGPRRGAAVVAAVTFGLHPLRVEPVAWASALPYPLALACLLGSVLAYLAHADRVSGRRTALVGSIVLYGASLLSRPAAPALPLVLLLLDCLRGRFVHAGWKPLLVEKLPYAGLAILATAAEAGARRFANLELVGLDVRLADAVAAPFTYLQRTIWPVGLSPLDPQSLEPHASWLVLLAFGAALAGVTALAFRTRTRHPALAGAWVTYLLLLGPAAGLTPSGLQATADRYAYFPGVVVALVLGAAFARLWSNPARRRATTVAGVAGIALLAVLTRHQLAYWRDSQQLWTRSLQLDPRNDVAAYNLALALDEAGDAAKAEGLYRQVLELVPDHGPARHNLGLLEAERMEREGAAEAAAGRLEDAVARYSQALERDPARLHARRSRGMALAQLGRFGEAIADLEAAAQAADAEPAVAGALAYALAETGRKEEARSTLRRALARHPGDARLLESLGALEGEAPRE